MKKLALRKNLFGESVEEPASSSKLAEQFGVSPFSVLNAREGYWQNRKRDWLRLGIQSELGRDAVSYQIGDKAKWEGQESEGEGEAGTSVFDPVLCEQMYTWFCPPGGLVLDSFAGGSVRGIVASRLGLNYVGVDLSKKQIEANREQAAHICAGYPTPQWQVGNSINYTPDVEADFLFSCPPYGDLEQYSKNPNDLSTMSWTRFTSFYRQTIRHAVGRLKAHRFACFVVGSIRDQKTTQIRDLPGETVRAFEEAGMQFYNEIILVTAVGSLPVRSKQFTTSRKIGKTHQNVLVFVKGNWKEAIKKLKEV